MGEVKSPEVAEVTENVIVKTTEDLYRERSKIATTDLREVRMPEVDDRDYHQRKRTGYVIYLCMHMHGYVSMYMCM